MKRIIRFGLVLSMVLVMAQATLVAAAEEVQEVRGKSVDIASSSNHASVGLAIQTKGDLWASVNVDSVDRFEQMSTGVSLLYRVPKKLIIWSFYGGPGVSYQPSSGNLNLHIVLGSEFLWFFSECQYNIDDNAGLINRSGIRLRF